MDSTLADCSFDDFANHAMLLCYAAVTSRFPFLILMILADDGERGSDPSGKLYFSIAVGRKVVLFTFLLGYLFSIFFLAITTKHAESP